MSDTVAKFVEFMKARWRADPRYSNMDSYSPPDEVLWGSDLIWHGSPDTDGYGSVAVDFNALCRQIDEFAAEFVAQADKS